MQFAHKVYAEIWQQLKALAVMAAAIIILAAARDASRIENKN